MQLKHEVGCLQIDHHLEVEEEVKMMNWHWMVVEAEQKEAEKKEEGEANFQELLCVD